jgi:hypothetical protein
MLHRVREIDIGAVDLGRRESSIQHLPSRADERLAPAVFHVAGLLPDEHHPGLDQLDAEHNLRGRLVQVAPSAGTRRPP